MRLSVLIIMFFLLLLCEFFKFKVFDSLFEVILKKSSCYLEHNLAQEHESQFAFVLLLIKEPKNAHVFIHSSQEFVCNAVHAILGKE